jgi:DNA-binding GntR family transcriptional regulator
MKIERTIDRESKLKLYVQIYTIIREKIESSEWPAGTQIPTEDDLCKTYDVSKVTVREAIQELAREGYLRRQQGKGTFVLYPVLQLGLVMRTRLTDILHGEGVTDRKEILENRSMTPSDDIKSILHTDEDVHYVLFKKYIDGEPSILEELYFPVFMTFTVDDEDILYKSFLDVIEEKGARKISRIVQACKVERLKRDFSLHLGMQDNSYALVVGRVFFSSDGSPIAYTKSTINSGQKIQMEFERIK